LIFSWQQFLCHDFLVINYITYPTKSVHLDALDFANKWFSLEWINGHSLPDLAMNLCPINIVSHFSHSLYYCLFHYMARSQYDRTNGNHGDIARQKSIRDEAMGDQSFHTATI